MNFHNHAYLSFQVTSVEISQRNICVQRSRSVWSAKFVVAIIERIIVVQTDKRLTINNIIMILVLKYRRFIHLWILFETIVPTCMYSLYWWGRMYSCPHLVINTEKSPFTSTHMPLHHTEHMLAKSMDTLWLSGQLARRDTKRRKRGETGLTIE